MNLFFLVRLQILSQKEEKSLRKTIRKRMVFLCVNRKFVFVDFKGNFGCISVYHCNDDIYEQIRDQTDVYVVDPNVKDIKLTVNAEDVREKKGFLINFI